jgi:Flp pilus assembly protein TadD/TolB-like protein
LKVSVGDRVGPYKILAPLGAGGMGEVYRARDEKLARDVAVKILPFELSMNTDALRRFEAEARAASALNHPNIVTIYEVSRTDDVAWIAMELIDGDDLRTVIEREPPPLKNVLRIAGKIADGLAAAHERGIAHRDLKPDNVMISRDGFVKVLDFGLAKQLRKISSNDATIPQTVPGTVFGTVSYMSPEQARGREMDYRSDQFSFGVMLYELLTHKRPFDRDSKPETMTAIIRDDAPPPSQLNDFVPRELDRIVMRCLAKQARDRYGSTRDLAHDLREVRDGLTFPSQKSGAAGFSPSNSLGGLRARRSTVMVAAGILLLALIAFVGVGLWNRTRAPERIDSVAVVPFRDLTGTAEGRMLADGISEMIATRLSEVRQLRVAAPFDGAPVSESDDLRAAARRKRVQAVIRGSVQRGGNDVRVSYALIRAADGGTLFSNTTTRPAAELFALEDAVSGDLLSSLGHTAPPRAQLSVAGALGPDDQRRYIEALGLLKRVRNEQSVDRAIATLESLLGNARESGEVNALLARALLYKASLTRRPALIEQATVYAARGVTLSADNPEVHVTLGVLHNASGRYEDARQAFERALALRPNDSNALTGKAEALEGLGRAADAEAAYKRAIALHPDSAGAHMQYGAFCHARGRYADAAAQFRRATELSPDFSTAWSNLGGALKDDGKPVEAMIALQKSIELKPTSPAYSNLGGLQFLLGRYDDAERSYERAAALAPTDFVAWSNLGDARRWSKSSRNRANDAYARAVAAAQVALSVNSNDAYTRAAMAACLARSGKLDEAQNEIRRALEIDPTNPVVLYKAAVVAAVRGNTDSAQSWIERAVRAGYPADSIKNDPEFAGLRLSVQSNG